MSAVHELMELKMQLGVIRGHVNMRQTHECAGKVG
jgi:hypothetical protein